MIGDLESNSRPVLTFYHKQEKNITNFVTQLTIVIIWRFKKKHFKPASYQQSFRFSHELAAAELEAQWCLPTSLHWRSHWSRSFPAGAVAPRLSN